MDTTGYYLLKDNCVLYETVGAGFCAIISVIVSISKVCNEDRLSETQIFVKVAEAMRLCVTRFNETEDISLLSRKSQIVLKDKWTIPLLNRISNFNDTGRQSLPEECSWSKELLEYYLHNLRPTLGIFELYFFVEVPGKDKLVLINTLSPDSLSLNETDKRRIAVAQCYINDGDTDTRAAMGRL